MKSLSLHLILCAAIFVMLTTACAKKSPITQPTTPTALPVKQSEAGNHAPVILRVVEREETGGDSTLIHNDIYFTDPDGDAVAVVNTLISSSMPCTISDDLIQASAQEQRGEALVTATYGCNQKLELVIEARVLDQAGNLSAPALLSMSCIPPPLNIRLYLTNGLLQVLGLGCFLLAGFWLLFRRQPAERLPALRSTLLLFCLLFPMYFLYLIFHEGGHALANLTHWQNNSLYYVHPFSMSGYVRPVFDWNSALFHTAGAALVIPASLFVSLLFRKQRSFISLPFVLFFPWAAMLQGMSIMLVLGDFRNVQQITGLPAIVFILTGALIFCTGLLCFVLVLPCLGLAPKERKTLFVLPAGAFLWSLVGMVVAYGFVPGSPVDSQYGLLKEIFLSANSFPLNSVLLGLLLAGVYCTLYPRLPVSWRTEAVRLTWRDLRIPGLLAVISIILGMVIIT
jgi:hypothetical protein